AARGAYVCPAAQRGGPDRDPRAGTLRTDLGAPALRWATPAPGDGDRAGGAAGPGVPGRAQRRPGPAGAVGGVGDDRPIARRRRQRGAHHASDGRGSPALGPRGDHRPRPGDRPGQRGGPDRRARHGPAGGRGSGIRAGPERDDHSRGAHRRRGSGPHPPAHRASAAGKCRGRPGRNTSVPAHPGGRVPAADRTEPAMNQPTGHPNPDRAGAQQAPPEGSTTASGPAHAGASPWPARVLSHAGFEVRNLLRNGEQLLLTLILPAIALVVLARTDLIRLDTAGADPIQVATPGVLALAIMSSAFTSNAIATGFDRRAGALRLLATTHLGRSGLLGGKVRGVVV